MPLNVGPGRCICDVFQVENEQYDVIVLVLHRRNQNTAQERRTCTAQPLLLHGLPVQQRIDYKVALLTFKVRSTSTPSYLRCLIQDRQHSHNLRSTTTTLCQSSTTTTFAKHAYSALHPAGVAKWSTSFGWGKGGDVTSVGWQVTLSDPTWHVSSRSGVAG